MSRRFLRITQEAVYGTYDASGASIVVRLDKDSAFKPATSPDAWAIRDGSGLNVDALWGSETSKVGGSLATVLYGTQAQFLMGWALQRVNSGGTSPWTTDQLVNDLASCTIDFGYTRSNGTVKRIRYTGCKVASGSLSASKEQPPLIYTIQWIGSTPQGNTFDASSDPSAVVFPEPAVTDYPTFGSTYVFQHSRGLLSIGGSSRTNYENFSFTWKNMLDAYFDEFRFANAVKMNGRDISSKYRLRLKATPDDRAAWEAMTAQAVTVAFNNGTNTMTLNSRGKNRIDTMEEDLPLGKEFYYDLNLKGALDTSVATDLTMTFA